MQVIPSINAPDFASAKELIFKAAEFSPPGGGWVHIDVGDGVFTPNTTWGNPQEFKSLKFKSLNAEVHLMIESPDAVVLPWLAALSEGRASPSETGREAVKSRIIVHVESVEDPESLIEICKAFGGELGLAISPDTDIKELNVYFNKVKFYQVLAVTPGLTGQEFNNSVLEKIKFLRKEVPSAIIEVDGGINPETALLVKKAGANIIVSASYIWNNEDPKKAYEELMC